MQRCKICIEVTLEIRVGLNLHGQLRDVISVIPYNYKTYRFLLFESISKLENF